MLRWVRTETEQGSVMKQSIKKLFKSKMSRLFGLGIVLAVSAVGVVSITNAASGCTPNVAGGECDNNAIIRGGVTRTGLASAVARLDGVGKSAFNNAGIPGECSFGSTVTGVVTRDNRVIVGGQEVATNAYTYGRQYMAGSTQIPGGAYMRHPSVSFRSSSITSYVCMDGKEFKWAVISTCGNPVKATPKFKKNPHVGITKRVNKTSVYQGEKYRYAITVTNTGNVQLKNVLIGDFLKPGIEPVPGQPNVSYNRTTRKVEFRPTVTLNPRQSVTRYLWVQTSASTPTGVLPNIACVTTNHNGFPICDQVNIVIKKKNPKLKIEKDVSVAVPVNPNEEFTYTIKVTNTGNVKLTNAVITDTLPDDVVAVDNPNSRTITFVIPNLEPGQTKSKSFKAKALVSAPVDTPLINKACVDTDQTDGLVCDDATVKVKKPVYACDALNVTKVSNDTYSFVAQFTAQNGAAFKSVVYDFGDGKSTATTQTTAVRHTYEQPGTYNTRATVTFSVNGEDKTATSANCAKTITVAQPPVYTCKSVGVTDVSENEFRFNVDYTAANGAVLKNIAWNFGDGSPVVNGLQNPIQHTYSNAGTFNGKAVLTFTVNGEDKVVDSADCAFSVTVQPETPVYTCDALRVTKLGDLQYRFAVDYTATNGAVLKNFAYDFGDESETLITTDNPVEHTYAEPGDYVAKVYVTFTVDGVDKTVTSEACGHNINKPPVTPNCPIPGKEHLPADSPLCKETPTTTTPPPTTPTATVITDTGPVDVMGVFAATVVAGMISYRYVWLRRYQ